MFEYAPAHRIFAEAQPVLVRWYCQTEKVTLKLLCKQALAMEMWRWNENGRKYDYRNLLAQVDDDDDSPRKYNNFPFHCVASTIQSSSSSSKKSVYSMKCCLVGFCFCMSLSILAKAHMHTACKATEWQQKLKWGLRYRVDAGEQWRNAAFENIFVVLRMWQFANRYIYFSLAGCLAERSTESANNSKEPSVCSTICLSHYVRRTHTHFSAYTLLTCIHTHMGRCECPSMRWRRRTNSKSLFPLLFSSDQKTLCTWTSTTTMKK